MGPNRLITRFIGTAIAVLLISGIVVIIYIAEKYDRSQQFEHIRPERYRSSTELLAQDNQERLHNIIYRKFIRGNPRIRTIAITFDDGPHPRYTPQLLTILNAYHVKATFFVVGKVAVRYPELLYQEYNAGHDIGNHTYNHVNLTKLSADRITTEWMECNTVIDSILGVRPSICRPPGGDYNTAVIKEAMRSGLTTVLWTDDPGDYAKPGSQVIEERVFRHISNGGIILLHDGDQQTVNILTQMLQRLRHEGYTFVTIHEMMRESDRIDEP